MSAIATVPRTFESRIADLGFTLPLPPDWISHPLPEEQPDFSNPTFMVPLAAVTATHSALILAIAARPAYEDGTLNDWALYLLQHHGLKPLALGAGTLGGLEALVGEAEQPSELGPMRLRFAFVEDGGRLINLSFTAPEMLADSVGELWASILSDFRLTTPRGQSVQLYAGA